MHRMVLSSAAVAPHAKRNAQRSLTKYLVRLTATGHRGWLLASGSRSPEPPVSRFNHAFSIRVKTYPPLQGERLPAVLGEARHGDPEHLEPVPEHLRGRPRLDDGHKNAAEYVDADERHIQVEVLVLRLAVVEAEDA